jgi:predicted amidohydrolase YtcJ
MKLRWSMMLIVVLCLAGSAAPWLAAQQADMILHNGKILTVDKNFTIAQAIAITGNKITAVGTDQDVLRQAGPNTLKIDLKGRTVIPGLIDDHLHVVGTWPAQEDPSKQRHYNVDWRGVRNKQDAMNEMMGIMRKYNPPPGVWLRFDNNLGNDLGIAKILYDDLNKEDLDKVAPNNPIFLTMGIPDENGMFVNGVAWNILMKEHGNFIKKYGRYWLGANGQPDGHLEPPATRVLLNEHAPWPTAEQAAPGIKDRLDELSSEGMTTLSTKLRKFGIDAYKLLNQRSEQVLRLGYGPGYDYFGDNFTPQDMAKFKNIVGSGDDMNWVTSFATSSVDGVTTRACTNQKRIGGAFGILDGWYPQGQCHMDSEYKGGPPRSANISGNYFRDWLIMQGSMGIRLANDHVAGDRNIESILAIVEQLQKQYGKNSTKNWGMDHCYLVDPKDFKRLAADGVMMSCFPSPFMSPAGMSDIATSYGDKVANTMVESMGSMLKAGVRVSYESDGADRWLGLQRVLITRKDPEGKVWGPQERVDRPTALTTFTSQAADYVLKPDKIGSLEVGKLADLAVLDRDYLTIPDEDIQHIVSLLTIMDGKVRFIDTGFSNEYNLKPAGAIISTNKELKAKLGGRGGFAPPPPPTGAERVN